MPRNLFGLPTLLLLAAALLAGCGKADDGGRRADCSPGDCSLAPVGREIMYRFLDEGDLESANLMLEDRWPVPRFEPVHLPTPLTWTEDPYGENYWRFIFYSLRPTSNLLWAFRTTGDRRYRDKLVEIMQSFKEHGQETHWSKRDKHALAYRAMVVVNTLVKLDEAGALSDSERQMLLDLIQATGNALEQPGAFSVDYNHGITQAAALLLIAENFPSMPNAGAWGTLARERLDQLLETAVADDGVANENSVYYHFYMVTLFWQIEHWGDVNKITVTERLDTSLRHMLQFGTYIIQPNGFIPMLGASLARNMRRYEQTLYAEMASFDPNFGYALTAGAQGAEPPERLAMFPISGIAILRSGFGPPAEFDKQTQVVFDFGPYRTAHSDFDALNINLYSAGRTLLTDSGLYTYELGPWQSYFHGTRAHNTVVVDGADQAEGSGAAGLTSKGDGWLYQSASHGLYAGVTHRRGVALLQRDLVLVVDRLEGTAAHQFDQTWHFEPDVEVGVSGTDVNARDAKGPILAVRQGLVEGVTATTIRGSENPIAGWYSREYEVKEPTTTLTFGRNGTEANFVTLFASGPLASGPVSVRAAADGASFDILTCAAGDGRRVTISNLAAAGEAISVVADANACAP